jgi:hypothetical protein
MDLLTSIDPRFTLSGFFIGLLVGQTGVGGGSLMTPLLILVFGIHPATAVGTDLLYAAATKTAGTLAHGAHGTVNWRLTGLLASGSVPATIITVLAMRHINPASPESAHILSVILGVVLLLTALGLLGRGRILAWTEHRMSWLDGPRRTVLTVLLGVILGVIVTLSSVGAGAIGVTVMAILYRKMPLPELVGSDIAHAVPLTLIAGLGHWMSGSVDGPMLLSLLSGSIPGIIIGTLMSVRMPEAVLRAVLAVTLLMVGGKLLF